MEQRNLDMKKHISIASILQEKEITQDSVIREGNGHGFVVVRGNLGFFIYGGGLWG